MLLMLKDTKCNILKLSDGSLMDLIKNSTSASLLHKILKALH